MIKKALANRYVRKASVFLGIFALTCAVMGGTLANRYDIMSALGDGYLNTSARDSDMLSSERHSWLSALAAFRMDQSLSIEGDDEVPPQASSTEVRYYAPPVGDSGFSSASMTEFACLNTLPISQDLQAYTYQCCEALGLDYPLVLAVMWRESRFLTDAVNVNTNGTTDSGIMQINDVNRGWLEKELAITDLMDPYQNVRAGTEMLSRFARKYGEHNALLAYQYGENGMLKKLEEGVTTNRQVQVVYEKRDQYRALLEQAADPLS